MKLIIAEKPSVAQTIAAALGVKEKKDGYIEGGGCLISWCVGHLITLFTGFINFLPFITNDKIPVWLPEFTGL